MRDYGLVVRKAFYDKINGQINSGPDNFIVPVVDEKIEDDQPSDLFIALKSQSVTQQDSKSTKRALCQIRLDIVQFTRTAKSSTLLDYIADQILFLIYPNERLHSLVPEGPYQISTSKLDSMETLPLERVDNGYLSTKSLYFSNRINQQ